MCFKNGRLWDARTDSCLDDFDDGVDDIFHFVVGEFADRPQDDTGVSCEEAVGANIALPRYATAHEVIVGERYGVAVFDGSTGNHAENDIIALQRSDDKSRASLTCTEIGKGKGKDNHLSLYKSAHASSSSGESHSRESVDSDASMVW